MRKGFTLIELLIVIAIIAILAAIAVPNFLEAQTRAKVARVKADQRSLATGIEAYYVDNNRYPAWVAQTKGTTRPWTSIAGAGHINAFSGTGTGASSIHSFQVRNGSGNNDNNTLFFMLTTPVAYISSLFPDPFADTKGSVYGYYAVRSGWIVISFGPDADEAPNEQGYSGDIDPSLENPVAVIVKANETPPPDESPYNPNRSQPSLTLLCGDALEFGSFAFSYDPTNGTNSEGDVFRVKQ